MLKLCNYILLLLLGSASLGVSADDIYIRSAEGASDVLSNVPETGDFTLLLAGPPAVVAVPEPVEPAPTLSQADWDPKSNLLARAKSYVPWVNEAARSNKLDAHLLHAVIAAESAYNPRARSAKGAQGIMQLMPATAKRYGVRDSFDARQNIAGGARYLADLLRLFKNDTRLALAAYNAGEYAVWRYGGKIPPYRETEAYVPRVLSFYRRFQSAAL
jgi:soluble lytic murein transglycosylase-like protein